MPIPDGWTDDMSIALPDGVGVDAVVEVVLTAEAAGEAYDSIQHRLLSLGLSEEDACLAHDRALGGIVRAATGNPANEPVREKDPVAWASYQRGLAEPHLVRAIRPDMVKAHATPNPMRPWWKFWGN